MEYRRATLNDIDTFIQNRTEFVTSIRNIPDIELFKKNTKEYLLENMYSNNVIICIAVENNSIAASCMACIFKTAPLPSCLSGETAELLNIYTKEPFRKKGHARKLLEMLITELRNIGVEKVLLEYTAEAFSLYKKMGFAVLENQMILKLR